MLAMFIYFRFEERQIQNHGTSNINYLTQLAKVENQCKDIFKQCSQVLATVDKVETNSKYLNLHKPLSISFSNLVITNANIILEFLKDFLVLYFFNFLNLLVCRYAADSVLKNNRA